MDKQRKQFIEHKEKGPKKLGFWSSNKASYIHLSLDKVAGKMVGGRSSSLSLSRIVTKTKVGDTRTRGSLLKENVF